MRERIFILLSLVIIVVVLVGLNAASYVRVKEEPDTEAHPRRTSFNNGATGTKAFYDFLRETGKRAVRWQQKPSALLDKGANQPKVFIITGDVRREFGEEEIRSILDWTRQGGRLVIVDRQPNSELLPVSGTWKISVESKPAFLVGLANSDNVNEMTSGVSASKPTQPSILLSDVNSVMPSKYASAIRIDLAEATKTVSLVKSPPAPKPTFDDDEPPPPPTPASSGKNRNAGSGISASFAAPVPLLASGEKTILVDYVYGAGRIVFLSDPYVISNGGIALADNLQLAANLVDSDGVVAFDEYHQGYGASGNALLNYFENTPLPAIAAQLAIFVLLLLYTKGRRFARPIPLPNPDRRSKLEYVAAMAELQRRARTYDLAIENIYTTFRRALARFAGVDNAAATRQELAARVAERSKVKQTELENLMEECEGVIQGDKINDKKALALVARLREIERELGLRKNQVSH